MRYRPKSATTTNANGEGDQNGLETSRSSTIDTAVDDHGRNGDGDGDQPRDGAGKGAGKEEMIVVDWYGPDDPENPQNWYVTSFSLNQFYVLVDVEVDKVYLVFNRKIKKTPLWTEGYGEQLG